jgi:hypothetical protein
LTDRASTLAKPRTEPDGLVALGLLPYTPRTNAELGPTLLAVEDHIRFSVLVE